MRGWVTGATSGFQTVVVDEEFDSFDTRAADESNGEFVPAGDGVESMRGETAGSSEFITSVSAKAISVTTCESGPLEANCPANKMNPQLTAANKSWRE